MTTQLPKLDRLESVALLAGSGVPSLFVSPVGVCARYESLTDILALLSALDVVQASMQEIFEDLCGSDELAERVRGFVHAAGHEHEDGDDAGAE